MTDFKQEKVSKLKQEYDRGAISRRDFIRLLTALGVSVSAVGMFSDSALAGEQGSTPQPQENYTIVFDPTQCTGCLSCAVACADKFMQEIAPEQAKDSINLEFSRIRPMRFQFVDFVNICQYCELIKWAEGTSQHPCQAVCPTGAILTVDKGEGKKGYTGMGYMTVDREKCLGIQNCGRCLEVCEEQFGSGISFDPIEGKAQVCTRCGGDPECVKACPEQGALKFIPTLVNGRYYANQPDEAAELLYKKMYNKNRGL
ncbi:MAG: twin-arginine translocation signal domain-containing protein [Thermodesulfobacteriota bacterium]